MANLYYISFWAAIVFIIAGGVIGLCGVWVKDFWSNSLGSKLIFTDMILAGTSISVALVLRWIGK